MDPTEPAEPPGIPVAPPTTPGPLGPTRREQSWPRTVGIILVVIGSISVIAWGLRLIQSVMEAAMGGTMGGMDEMEAMFQVYAEYAWLSISTDILNLLAGAMLLGGGVLLLLRRKLALLVLLNWAWIKVIVALASALVTYAKQRDLMDAMMTANAGTGMPVGMSHAMALGQAVFYFVIGIIVPIFVLFFFVPRKIRRQMRSWDR